MLDDQTYHSADALLDSPVAASFAGSWQPFSECSGRAKALRSNIGQFAACAGGLDQDQADFAALVSSRKAPVIMVQASDISVPKSLEIVGAARCVQMVSCSAAAEDDGKDYDLLGADDRDEMLALATLTKPGPFERDTPLLGNFLGIRVHGQLVAMAGQRMAFGDWVEISGVCVHPDFRGQGLARQLVVAMMGRIAKAGRTPFLHTYTDNVEAIRLYERLGFEVRRELNVAMVK